LTTIDDIQVLTNEISTSFGFGGFGLCCLTPLSTIFQLYRGGLCGVCKCQMG